MRVRQIVFIAALLPVIAKLVAFMAGVSAQDTQTGFIIGHLLLILLGVFFAQMFQPADSTFIEDVKMSMKNVGTYSIINAAFLFIYYKYIDIAYFPNRIASMVEQTNNLPEGTSVEQVTETYELFFTAFNWSTLSLLAWMITGVIYTLLFTAFHRKFLRKFK